MAWHSKFVILLLAAAMVLAACGGTGGAGDTSREDSSATGAMITSSGFECPDPSPKMEVDSEELNLFVWTEYIPSDIIECFELAYGIKVNREEYSSNEEMYAKLSAGGANYDLVQPTDYIIGLMIRQGLLQKLDKSKLPSLANFDPSYLDLPFDPGNEYTVPYQAGADAIVVNTERVQNVPASFADLWKPEYAGKMVFLDDSRAVISVVLLTLGYDINTTDPAELEAAKAKLAELVPNVKLFDSDSPKSALIAGDADLGFVWTAEAELARQENPAIQFVYPSEGAILWQDNYTMPATAPHPDAAYAWINYSMQPELFWLMLRDFPYINPNKAALDYARTNQPDLYNQYMESNITNMPAAAVEQGHYIEDVGDATPLYDRIWTEAKGE